MDCQIQPALYISETIKCKERKSEDEQLLNAFSEMNAVIPIYIYVDIIHRKVIFNYDKLF